VTCPDNHPDLLLLFPGVTEARHFPYLSLPQMTAYLRAHGYTVEQRDHNIELSRALLTPEAIDRRLHHTQTLSSLRVATLRYLRERAGTSQVPFDITARIELNGIDAMLNGSALTRRVARLEELVPAARAAMTTDDTAAQIYEQLVRDTLRTIKPRVLGFSIAFFSQFVPAIRAAILARELSPDSWIVFGGQQIMMREPRLRHCDGLFEVVDQLCAEAGEHALPALIDDRRGGSGSRSSAPPRPWRFRDNPPPEFDGLPFEGYFADPPQLPVLSCIGCYWANCTFCSYGNRTLTSGYQQLDHKTLAESIAAGLRRTGARRITFVDENSNIKVLVNAMERVRELGFDAIWSTRNRMEPMLTDPAFCQRLARAGCVLMSVGYETVSQRLLDAMNKGVRASTYQAIIDNLNDASIALRISVMGGLPTETQAEAAQSRQFLVRNAHKIGIDVAQMLMIEPGTIMDLTEPAGVTRGSDDTLLDNTGFSYLGGRVGRMFDYHGDARRADRTRWLAATVDAVLPGKNDERHPRFRQAHMVTSTRRLALHPWVVDGTAPGGGLLHDVRWKLTYRLPTVVRREGRDVIAASEQARRTLGLLAQADAGVEIDTGENL
jgi:hypothetical protein